MDKVAIHAAQPVPEPYLYRGVTIAVRSIAAHGRVLRVELDATGCKEHEFLFVNPPLQVEAGTDDPAAALRVMVGEAVLRACR